MSNIRKSDNPNGVRVYALNEIASLYGVSKKTFKKWLKPFEKDLGQRVGNFYSVKQVKIIFNKLGTPDGISDYE